MKEKTVLVTGASRGIGRSLALDLSSRGFEVFGGVRNDADAEALREAGDGTVTPVQLDVTDAEQISAVADRVADACGDAGLWGLVNNAAVLHFGPLETTSLDDFRQSFEVNLFGVLAVTKALLPSLRQAGGRIVNISSVNGILSMPLVAGYCSSKFALEALSDSLRMELARWGIRVSVVQPGSTTSEIRVRAVDEWTKRRAALSADQAALYADFYESSLGLSDSFEEHAADHEHVCAAAADALTSDEPKTRYLAGPDTPQFVELAALSDAEKDAAILSMWESGHPDA